MTQSTGLLNALLILGIDTSGKQGSIALARGDKNGFELIDVAAIAGGTFSAELVPQIAELLARHGLSKKDLGGVAAASGPGSFTGLRVGLAAVKALAEILKIPVGAVSVLEAMTAQALANRKVLALLDAGRQEVFAGIYETGQELPRKLSEQLVSQGELRALIGQTAPAVILTPDDSLLPLLAHMPAQKIERPGSAQIAALGLRKIMAGETVSVEALDANYIRRSDAEVFSSPSHTQ